MENKNFFPLYRAGFLGLCLLIIGGGAVFGVQSTTEADIRKEVVELLKEIDAVRVVLRQTREETESGKGELKRIKASVAEYSKTVEDLKTERDNLEKDIAGKKASQKQLDSDISGKQATLAKLEEDILAGQSVLERSAMQAGSQVPSNLSMLEGDAALKQAALAQQDKDIESRQLILSQLDKDIASKKATLEEQEKEIASLRQTTAEMSQSVEGLRKEQAQLREETATLSADLVSATEQLAVARKALSDETGGAKPVPVSSASPAPGAKAGGAAAASTASTAVATAKAEPAVAASPAPIAAAPAKAEPAVAVSATPVAAVTAKAEPVVAASPAPAAAATAKAEPAEPVVAKPVSLTTTASTARGSAAASAAKARMDEYSGLITTVFFEPDDTGLVDYYLPRLERVGTSLAVNPNQKIVLRGYTAKAGTLDGQERISRGRAETVRNYLVNTYNLKDNQIELEWFGAKALPLVVQNGSVSCRRAVEIIAYR
jgi:outer membrane protein OmpA-like peptidoglycan-associated protein